MQFSVINQKEKIFCPRQLNNFKLLQLKKSIELFEEAEQNVEENDNNEETNFPSYLNNTESNTENTEKYHMFNVNRMMKLNKTYNPGPEVKKNIPALAPYPFK